MHYLLHLLLILASLPAFSCINMVERVPGVSQEAVEFYAIGHVVVDQDSLLSYIVEKKAACDGQASRACNDMVIAYLFAKQFSSALALSTRLVAKYPQDYNVVITHAAALELNGQVADAIPYMEKAIALNPGSHKGSEWIHLNLLRQRLKGDSGVSPWALIGVELRPDSTLVEPDGVDLKSLVKQVHYQVNDRMYFTPDHDPLFGALVFAYADLLHLNGYRNQAKRAYELAAAYGYTFRPVARIAVAEVVASAEPPAQQLAATPPRSPEPKKNPLAEWVAGIFIGLIVLLVVGFVWKNSRTDP
ncbi:MAG: hypothetical protein IPL52_04250 [Flavobacteriales bacterium]|nr:hypothetical protein [Flavobacteriales bacterium]